MKVICKENIAENLDSKEFLNFFCNRYSLTVGKEYIVMGIRTYIDTDCPYYLIDINMRSFWMPYNLFEITDKAFPPNWHIRIFDKKTHTDSCIFMAGFYELCNYEKFYIDLIELELVTLATYFKRKDEVLQWHEEREEARKFYPKEAKVYYSIND